MPVHIMGVLNVTPDSFSDGGRWLSHEAAIAHGRQMLADGADLIDVGGESTRPGASPVSADEEMARVVQVIEALAPHVRVSIDTMKAEVAVAAVRAGATMINDVSAELFHVAADTGVGWIAMHMQGEPRTMQASPTYENVVAEVSEYLLMKAEMAKTAGVSEIWLDPGIGFGKTVAHNCSLLRHLDVLTSSPFPIALGTSRKSFLGALTSVDGEPAAADDRLEASLATVAWACANGVSMVRVHDVKETMRVARVMAAIGEAA